MKSNLRSGRRTSNADSIKRRGSRSRSRSVTERMASRRGSTVSNESNYLYDDNNQEMYSGAGSEIIPSSISSFHYPHSFGTSVGGGGGSSAGDGGDGGNESGFRRGSSMFRKNSEISRETSPLLVSHSNDQGDVHSISSNETNRSGNGSAHFKFFRVDEIEQAPGGSTLENPEDPVDYNTDWEYPVDKYETDDQESRGRVMMDDLEERRSHGSSDFERRRRRSSNSTFDSQADLLYDDYEPNTDTNDFDSQAEYQRFYLAEEDLVIGIAGYKNNTLKLCLYWLLCIVTLGVGYLILRWLPRYQINLIGDKAPLGIADWCVIENEYGELSIVNITKERFNERLSSFLTINDENDAKDPIVGYIHSFNYRYMKFFYNPIDDIFKTNNNWYDIHWLNKYKVQDGISQSMYDERLMIFGENTIEIDDKSILSLLMDEVLHPFYIFQIFSILLWLIDDYFYYASCIFLISVISIVNTLVETKLTIRRLKSISRFNCEIRVWRNEFWKTIDSSELVPGDIYEIDPSLTTIPCDGLLINGECIVNESMLTGESVPVTKSEVADDDLSYIKDNMNLNISKSYLYNGTKLLKKRSSNDEPVKALVIKTGFSTTKGSLIRSMLFPKPIGFKFYEDSFKYIGFMSLIAAIGFIYSTINFIKLGVPKSLMVLRALDIITIVVPPALPATLTIGTTFAINRLKKFQIFCISPTRVNIGGKLDVVCFDKTGTLTEDGLDVLGVHVVNNAKGRKEMMFEELSKDVSNININKSDERTTNNGPLLISLMSACHSLRLIDNDLLGDPLDYKMFEFTKSIYDEQVDGISVYNKPLKTSYRIIKEFEFQSQLRRMSAIIENNNEKYVVCKGAPEVMIDICTVDSIPQDFHDLLYYYTNNGYRVIACATKKVTDLSFTREELEQDMEFLGFIVFENKLKDHTRSTIKALEDAHIRTIMCTGDNILTAISVGKESNILDKEETIYVPRFSDNEEVEELLWEDINDETNKLDPETLIPYGIGQDKGYKLAITGRFFKYLLTNFKDHELFNKFLLTCDIFARMSPDEKHELINQLQKIDYTVGFVGDGANDCGALKAADVGISLSEAEASIAAPFTSRIFEISCLLNVIREGRSSLVTSFSSFKYMSLYSAIQFITVSILYKRGTNLGDFQFLYIDLFLILPLAIFMSWSKPSNKIIIKRPTANLVSMKILMTLVLNILIILTFQLMVWFKIQKEPWYQVPTPGDDENVKSFDNTILFLFTNFQYILISIVLSAGPPYRQKIWYNKPYLINLIVIIFLSASLFMFDSNSTVGNIFQVVNLPKRYYTYIIIYSVVNLIVMNVCESLLYDKLYYYYKKIFKKSSISKKKYKNLKKEFTKLENV